MDSLQNMRVFQAVADTESFTQAAERLNISRTVATRQIMQLEQSLGARLLNRTTRRISLTPIGSAYLERITPALAELDAASEVAHEQTRHATGTLRVNAPVSLGVNYLGAAVAEFLQLNPNLRIDLNLNDRRVDPTEEGFDVAIRVTSTPSPTQISRRISRASLALFASSAYIQKFGLPMHPDQLQANCCLSYSYLPVSHWTFNDPQSGKQIQVPIRPRISANNGDLLADICANSVGVVQGPYFTVSRALKQHQLVEILKPFWPTALDVHAVMPSRRFQPAKVRQFIDFLVSKWGINPPWETTESDRNE